MWAMHSVIIVTLLVTEILKGSMEGYFEYKEYVFWVWVSLSILQLPVPIFINLFKRKPWSVLLCFSFSIVYIMSYTSSTAYFHPTTMLIPATMLLLMFTCFVILFYFEIDKEWGIVAYYTIQIVPQIALLWVLLPLFSDKWYIVLGSSAIVILTELAFSTNIHQMRVNDAFVEKMDIFACVVYAYLTFILVSWFLVFLTIVGYLSHEHRYRY